MNPLVVVVRAVVTVALLLFAWATDDPSTGPLVVGAVVGYWLRAGEARAQTIRPRHDPPETR